MVNQRPISLEELIKNVETHLSSSGYSEKTIKRYHDSWQVLLERCLSEGIRKFSYENCLSLVKQEYDIPVEGNLKGSHVFYIRTVKILEDFATHNQIFRCHQKAGKQVCPIFLECLNCFVDYARETGLSERTINSKRIQMTRFLNFISEKGVEKLENLSAECVLLYVQNLKDSYYANQSRSGILFTLRNFLFFLFEKQYIYKPIHELFPVIFSNKAERIPSYYFENEIRKILSQVNRNNIIGKRDYLILLLAVQLGIRAGDIRMLKMEHIHWDKNTIEFIQNKTRNPIQLPLPENIKFAMIDYIRNGRSKSVQPYLFLRNRAPYESYSTTNVFH